MPTVVMHRIAVAGLACLILLSLAVKQTAINYTAKQDQNRLSRDIAKILLANGYAVTLVPRPHNNTTIIKSKKGACHVWLRDATVHGDHLRASNRQMLGTAGPVRFAYRGEWRDDFPSLWIEMLWRTQRELGRVGIGFPMAPVLAVAASPECRPPAQIFEPTEIKLTGL